MEIDQDINFEEVSPEEIKNAGDLLNVYANGIYTCILASLSIVSV